MKDDPSVVAWVRSRPAEVQDTMRQLPPGTRVRAKAGRDLVVPGPGQIGRVVSWFENGNVGVVTEGGGEVKAECEPGWLDVVGYPALTPADIAGILDVAADE